MIASSFNWKKIINAGSLLAGIFGFLLVLVLFFLINNTLDKTSSTLGKNFDDTHQTLLDVENTIISAEQQIDSANATFDTLQGSITPISSGLQSTGDALDNTGTLLSQLSFLGPLGPPGSGNILNSSANGLKSAGVSLWNSSSKLLQVGQSIESNKEKLADFKSKLSRVRSDFETHRSTVLQTKKTISDIFGTLKLVNLLLLLVFACMFSMLSMNSAAGFFG